MGVPESVVRLLTADIEAVLAEAPDPEAAAAELMRDLKESILELRREMVVVVGRERQLARELAATGRLAGSVERQVSWALDRGDELLARQIVSRHIGTLTARDVLEDRLARARRLRAAMPGHLVRMENQASLLRRKSAELDLHRHGAGADLPSGAGSASLSGIPSAGH
jgi:phage shock protein A